MKQHHEELAAVPLLVGVLTLLWYRWQGSRRA